MGACQKGGRERGWMVGWDGHVTLFWYISCWAFLFSYAHLHLPLANLISCACDTPLLLENETEVLSKHICFWCVYGSVSLELRSVQPDPILSSTLLARSQDTQDQDHVRWQLIWTIDVSSPFLPYQPDFATYSFLQNQREIINNMTPTVMIAAITCGPAVCQRLCQALSVDLFSLYSSYLRGFSLLGMDPGWSGHSKYKLGCRACYAYLFVLGHCAVMSLVLSPTVQSGSDLSL